MNYYKNMSKEDKKQLKENFKNEDNYLIYIKANRIFVSKLFVYFIYEKIKV